MKRWLLFLVFATSLAGAEPGPEDGSTYLNGFIGGTWVARRTDSASGGSRTIELTFSVPASHTGVRFESTNVAGPVRRPYVSGLYAWDPSARKFRIFYTDSEGSVTWGEATVAGPVLMHELTEVNSDGSVDKVRVKLTRLGPDEFTDEIAIFQRDVYVPIASVRYVRTRPSHQP